MSYYNIDELVKSADDYTIVYQPRINRNPPSMVDVLEADYNAKYEEWKKKFYHDNMTDTAPVTIGHIVNKSLEKRENDVIRFLIIALLVIMVIFWIIPAMYYHNDAAKMNGIGTLDILEDLLTERELNGVYIKDNEEWREANDNEIEYYMERNPRDW